MPTGPRATTQVPEHGPEPGRGRRNSSPVARVAHGLPGVYCFSPSEDRSALLLDIYEDAGGLTIQASAPGALPEDIAIQTAGDVVTIRVKTRPAKRPAECTTVRRERYAGHWQRSVELPFTIEAKALSWELDHGILTIHIAKPESPRVSPYVSTPRS